MSLGAIYTFGPTFRAENSNTPRHLAEFWMVEPEVAFNEIEENMDLAEDFLKYLIRYALDNCQDDLEFLSQMYDSELIERLKFVVENDFVRLPYTEGVKILEESGHKFEYPVYWGADLQSEHERFLVEEHFKKPVILTDYPKEIKAFYMKLNDDGKTVRAMDVLFPRIGEIIGGSQREENYEKTALAYRRAAYPHERYVVVPRYPSFRYRTPLGLRPRVRASGTLRNRHDQHPRCDTLPPYAEERRVLSRGPAQRKTIQTREPLRGDSRSGSLVWSC